MLAGKLVWLAPDVAAGFPYGSSRECGLAQSHFSIRDLLDEALLVSEADIKHARRLLTAHERWLVEGIAAVALAGLRQAAARYANRHLVAVLCGRNIGWERWHECLQADVA